MITDFTDEYIKANQVYSIGVLISITIFGVCLLAGLGPLFCWIGYVIAIFGCRAYANYRRQLVHILFKQYVRTLK